MLVHLDLKPENIFISLDHPVPSPGSSRNTSNNSEPSAASPEAAAAVNEVDNANNVGTTTEDDDEAGIVFSGNESTDSGHHSGGAKKAAGVLTDGGHGAGDGNSPTSEVSYKIGDLGHVASINGDSMPEEGDCRYMAPELLAMSVNRELLPKADIFSLGLTLYEAACLKELPKNSLEDPSYENIKSGNLPYVHGYSKDFNNLLKVCKCSNLMVN